MTRGPPFHPQLITLVFLKEQARQEMILPGQSEYESEK
jgi:hypothetical protein